MQSEMEYLTADGRASAFRGFPKNVVIVGGSLSGLMHANQLSHYGIPTTILEQDPHPQRRQAQAAGIGFDAAMEGFLLRYFVTEKQISLPMRKMRLSFGRYAPQWTSLGVSRRLSSWALIYRALREKLEEGDAKRKVVYRAGKQVVGIRYPAPTGAVTVRFSDVGTGLSDEIDADLVIGADGIHSTVRGLVGAVAQKEGAGYIVWRGIVSERDVSGETAACFANGGAANMLWGSYMICYIIPTDDGDFTPGNRAINWLWYQNVPENSPKLREILTDTEGRQHKQTVEAGRVRSEIWARHRDAILPSMAKPYAELLRAATSPFVTIVSDAISEESSFCDGHVILAGDAYAAFRPHLAAATNHAAWQCLHLLDLWTGQLSPEEWKRLLRIRSTRLWLGSRLLGMFGQGRWLDLLKTIWLYIVFWVTEGPRKPANRQL